MQQSRLSIRWFLSIVLLSLIAWAIVAGGSKPPRVEGADPLPTALPEIFVEGADVTGATATGVLHAYRIKRVVGDWIEVVQRQDVRGPNVFILKLWVRPTSGAWTYWVKPDK